MLTLALETTATPSGVALLSDEEILEERIIEGPRGVGLFPALDEILRAHGAAPGDVDLVGVGLGPGSFTGIRIGIAAAKGFIAFSGSRLIGIPTMDALIEETPAGHPRLVVALDAGRGRVYGAIFDLSAGEPRAELAPALLEAGALGERIPHGPAWLVGSGAHRYPDAYPHDALVVAPADAYPPRPSTIGRLAVRREADAVDAAGAGAVEPIYLQAPDAKTKREREETRAAARSSGRGGEGGR